MSWAPLPADAQLDGPAAGPLGNDPTVDNSTSAAPAASAPAPGEGSSNNVPAFGDRAINPFDQFDAAPHQPAAPRTSPTLQTNPFDQFDAGWTPLPADAKLDDVETVPGAPTKAQAQDAELQGQAPIVIRGHRSGPLMDSSGRAILQDADALPQGQDTGIIGEHGGTHTEVDPRFAGANKAVQHMLKTGASSADILSYLKSLGASDDELDRPQAGGTSSILQQLGAIKKFQHENPHYKGDYVVDLEHKQASNSTLQNVMGSDVGAAATTLGNAATAFNVPHIASALGANGDEVQRAIDASAAVHPKSALAGTIAGGAAGSLALEQGLAASSIPGLARVAPEAAEGIGAASPWLRPLLADTGYGAFAGASTTDTGENGQPATIEDRLKGAGEGAAAGFAGHIAGKGLGAAVGSRLEGTHVDENAMQAAQSAGDLGIDLPEFTLAGPQAQAKAAKITAQSKFGATGLGESAQTALDQSETARRQIASSVAQPRAFDASLGQDLSDAAIAQRATERSRIGRMFEGADEQMGATPIPLAQTKQALSDLTAGEAKALIPSAALPVLKQMQQRIDASSGTTTAASLRQSIQNLKGQMTANSVDATTSDHILGNLTDAMNGDLETAATQSGNDAALRTYADAREQWAASKQLDQSVLKPVLGTAFQNTGDQVANALNAAVKNNGTRVAQLLNVVPSELADTARASLIMRMGTTPATGDAFSLPAFLKNWNELSGSRRLIWAPETVQALDKLANVAQYGKALETVAQSGAKAQSKGFMSIGKMPLALLGESASLFFHSPKEAALGLTASALQAVGQFRAARLLADPNFAKRVAATPMNPKGAQIYWNRPWANAMAAKNPAIGDAIQSFRGAMNDNFNRYGKRALSVMGSSTASTQFAAHR